VQFTHDWLPQRVRFAPGGAAEAIVEEVRRLGAARVMAIASDATRAEPVLAGVPVVVLHTSVLTELRHACRSRRRGCRSR